MRKRIAFVFMMVLMASIAADIAITEAIGYLPWWLMPTKIALLTGILASSVFIKGLRVFRKLLSMLTIILASQWLFDFIKTTPVWSTTFPSGTFAGNFGGVILLKLVTVIPVVVALYLLTGSWKAAYLTRGNLGVKAERIVWLGIEGNKISWAKLCVVSAILISLGTVLLTILTATRGAAVQKLSGLLSHLPLILVFAVVNSACEGIVYRSAMLGALRDILPKGSTIFIAGAFFGIAHYYGVPSGIIGAAMSGVLGYYMCRSMYETEGFVSSWLIHFMQDVVIFSTLYLFGNFA